MSRRLLIVREPDFNAFAHLHPVRREARTFENVLPALPAGTYQLYGEVTHENGTSETLTTQVALPAPIGTATQAALDPKITICVAGSLQSLGPAAPAARAVI